MKFARLSFLVLLSAGLTSCQSWETLMNSSPVKLIDETANGVLSMFGENNLPTDGKPATMQERARQIESRGKYAGQAPAAAASSHKSMAAR